MNICENLFKSEIFAKKRNFPMRTIFFSARVVRNKIIIFYLETLFLLTDGQDMDHIQYLLMNFNGTYQLI